MARAKSNGASRARRIAACALVCSLSAACTPQAAPRIGVALPEQPASGTLSGTTYTAAGGAFSVAVPPVFRAADGIFPAVHGDLRLEDGRGVVEGARVDFVMFGPSSGHDEEIYHVVLAAPDPYRRYDDVERHADAVIAGYLEQYDRQHLGAATELVRKDVTVGERQAIYAAYRYDFATDPSSEDTHQRSYVSFCVFAAPGHRLVTTLVERRPSAVETGPAERWQRWRERSYVSGSCDGDWLASLELDVPSSSSLAYRRPAR